MKDVVRTLNDLIDELRLKLMQSSEEFRILCSLEKMIADIRIDGPMVRAKTTLSGTNNLQANLYAHAAQHAQAHAAHQKSLRSTVFEILSDAGQPLPIGEILRRLAEKGLTLNSRNPRAALSSNMSQDDRFENGLFEGKPMWRIRPQPLNGEASAAPVRPRLHRVKAS